MALRFRKEKVSESFADWVIADARDGDASAGLDAKAAIIAAHKERGHEKWRSLPPTTRSCSTAGSPATWRNSLQMERTCKPCAVILPAQPASVAYHPINHWAASENSI